jgi:AcrR family transcriptional regulator
MVYRRTLAAAARKDARRKLLLDAATSLFGSLGYHAATVPMIVAQANSSVGSFYAHFRNKEDVFAATMEELSKKVAEVMYQAGESAASPVLGISSRWRLSFFFWRRIRGRLAF